ncbi:hypothetical protein HZS_1794, partial [Henneguya salminicola]
MTDYIEKLYELLRKELEIANKIIYASNSELRHSIGLKRFKHTTSKTYKIYKIIPDIKPSLSHLQKNIRLIENCSKWWVREIKIGYHVNAFFMMIAVAARIRILLKTLIKMKYYCSDKKVDINYIANTEIFEPAHESGTVKPVSSYISHKNGIKFENYNLLLPKFVTN